MYTVSKFSFISTSDFIITVEEATRCAGYIALLGLHIHTIVISDKYILSAVVGWSEADSCSFTSCWVKY